LVRRQPACTPTLDPYTTDANEGKRATLANYAHGVFVGSAKTTSPSNARQAGSEGATPGIGARVEPRPYKATLAARHLRRDAPTFTEDGPAGPGGPSADAPRLSRGGPGNFTSVSQGDRGELERERCGTARCTRDLQATNGIRLRRTIPVRGPHPGIRESSPRRIAPRTWDRPPLSLETPRNPFASRTSIRRARSPAYGRSH